MKRPTVIDESDEMTEENDDESLELRAVSPTPSEMVAVDQADSDLNIFAWSPQPSPSWLVGKATPNNDAAMLLSPQPVIEPSPTTTTTTTATTVGWRYCTFGATYKLLVSLEGV